MTDIIKNYNTIIENIKKINPKQNVNIIAISKTFPIEHIKPLLDIGHKDFGENKVQEAESKWTSIKNNYPNVRLHMVGKLQRNKINKAINIFDYIHSLDNERLASTLAKAETNYKKKIKYFIQVNIGNEIQKSGINQSELEPFFNYCSRDLKLNILGLMAIPPNDNNTETYFKEITNLNSSLNMTELSLGMSADYLKAVKFKTTFIRIGSSIFGKRAK